MRMVYPPFGVDIDVSENHPAVLVMENPFMFQKLLGDLWKQLEGEEGDWILSQKDKILQISKTAVGIYNPFLLDCNEKRVLNKIYAELTETAVNVYSMETAELNGKIMDYLDALIQNVPYHLDSQIELDVSGLLKLYGIKVEMEQESLIERIIDYMKALHSVCRVDLFVFANLKHYLTDTEVMQLYELAAYEKMGLLLIEGSQKKKEISEKIWIYDQDLCMINLEN